MKKTLVILAAIILSITACTSKREQQLHGLWKMESMDLNGTVIRGESLGRWMYEFNDKGGYMVDVSGVKEKGKYKLEEKKLTLTSLTFEDKPATTFDVVVFDSVNLELFSKTDNNQTRIKLVKIAGAWDEEQEEKEEKEREAKGEMKKENS